MENPFIPPQDVSEHREQRTFGEPGGLQITFWAPDIYSAKKCVLRFFFFVLPVSALVGMMFAVGLCGSAGCFVALIQTGNFQALFALLGCLVVLLAATCFFLFRFDIMNGSFLARRIATRVRSRIPEGENWIVQHTLDPRYVTGIRAGLDDSDDVGILLIEKDRICFVGDCSAFELPRSEIIHVYRVYGYPIYGFFGLGSRLRLFVRPNNASWIRSLDIAECSGRTLFDYFRLGKKLTERLEQWYHSGMTEECHCSPGEIEQ